MDSGYSGYRLPPRPDDAQFNALLSASLCWLPEHGIGWYPVHETRYDADYFEKYRQYEDTELGQQILQARLDLVARHYRGCVLDVGIGSGQFVAARQNTYGYDVNPAGVAWLRARNRYVDLYVSPDAGWSPALTFWDSLEHIPDPGAAVARAARWVFASLPIFDDAAHVLRSRHFRRDEHYWYFTRDGFVDWMAAQGFVVREENDAESLLGRDGIMSFAFERMPP